jgi:23S rRNA (cytidine1920-2'-O)/16S rRNA (cytidine1409-2'-O)-methyltransferase
MSASPIRLDRALVTAGLAPSRSAAADLVRRGCVKVDGAPARKAGQSVSVNAMLAITGDARPYVSRGGLKLAAALKHFRIDPDGLTALDIGASTGGFTDVLLRGGARRVHAVDVGQGQLHASLRADNRVVVLEQCNARRLDAHLVPDAIDLLVCDVSFISLMKALPTAMELCRPGTELIALIKPQFEAGREHVGKGGIVRDEKVHREVCERIERWLEDDMGWRASGLMPSPITGPDGNREFLIAARRNLG